MTESYLPASTPSGYRSTHSGMTIPQYNDRPNIAKFLDDDRSTAFNVNIPIAESIPNAMNMVPPIQGSGTVDKTAPNLPIIDSNIHIMPVAIRPDRLAT